MSNNKYKGFFKGFRYISQIFDNEKEQDIQIGYPTDVKHVAHIGWDGPSVNSPSWMNEFKSSPTSATQNLTGDVQCQNKAPEDSSRRSSRCVNSRGQARDLPDLPRSSRRPSGGSNVTDSPTQEKSEKARQSKRSSKPKGSSDPSKLTRPPMPADSLQEIDSPSRSLPDIPKRARRKKSKDGSNCGGSSSKLRPKGQSSDSNSDLGSPIGSETGSRNKQRSFEDGQLERGFSELS